MTLEEKIGQMTQAEQDALNDVNDIQKYFLGSLLSGGGSDPKAGNSLDNWIDMYDGYQANALKTRLAIPILYGADAVHGHNNVLGAVIFPHNVGLGCTRNPQLVESAARVTAEEVRATGINWTFAPCVTVPRDERWGRTYAGFGQRLQERDRTIDQCRNGYGHGASQVCRVLQSCCASWSRKARYPWRE
jgi:beta-glucosidase